MATQALKLLTIIVDEALESTVEEDINRLGARGFTTTQVKGKGHSGERTSPWTGENVKIETIVAPEVSEKILHLLRQKYFDKYSIIAYSCDVNVIRTDHFV